MEIVGENLNFTSLHFSASESLAIREELVQKGGEKSYQRVSKYNLNFDLNYTKLDISRAQLKAPGYDSLKALKWATSNPKLAKTVADQIDELYKDDPEVAKKYLILMEFLEENNPEAAEKLAEKMDKALELKNQHIKAMKRIRNGIKRIVNKIQAAQNRDLEAIAERTQIKIDVKLEIVQKEKTIKANEESSKVSSFMKSIKLKMAIDIRVEHLKHQADPLIVDLDGDGFDLVDTKNGVMFDIDGDGKKELTSWITGDDAFLALDRNLNGKIDNGKELFGDQNGALNGFLELSKLDWDKNGILNFKDPMFKKLLLFRDLNGNGKSEKGELIPLYKAGISSINLNYMRLQLAFRAASLASVGTYQREDEKTGVIGDFNLFYI